jgi:hypothetical protein
MFYGFVIAHLHDEAKLLDLLGPYFPKVKATATDNTALTAFLVHSLKSPHTDIRRKAIEVTSRYNVAPREARPTKLPLVRSSATFASRRSSWPPDASLFSTVRCRKV